MTQQKPTNIGKRSATKGAGFERFVCKALSLMVTRGESVDVFWRTAGSGSRATRSRQRGIDVRQGGDVCAVAPEGADFCEDWFIECKFLKDLRITQFLLANTGPLARFWRKVQQEADKTHRMPMLIVKQNNLPILVITQQGGLEEYTACQLSCDARGCDISFFSDLPYVSGATAKRGKK